MTILTKEQFETGYAERSGTTVAELHDMGRAGLPCDCGDDTCQGWQMAHNVWEPPPRPFVVLPDLCKMVGRLAEDRGCSVGEVLLQLRDSAIPGTVPG